MRADYTRVSSRQRASGSSAFAILIVFGTIAALYFLRAIFIPLAFALALAFLLTPVVCLLEKLHLGRVLSVILTLVATVVLAGFAAFSIGNQLVDVINRLPTYRENIDNKIKALSLSQKGSLGRAADNVKEIGKELSTATPTPAPAPPSPRVPRRTSRPPETPVPVEMVQPSTNGFTYLRDVSASFLGPIAIGGIVVIFTIYMLVAREDLRNRLLRLGGLTQLNVMTQALDDAAKRVSRYLMMQFLVNACFGIVIATGLYFIGLPNPALWGVVAGILRIIPYVGTLVATSLPLFLSLAVFDGWHLPLLVFLLFATVEIIVANFVEPWLYGNHTGISSLALLVMAAFWTVIWGPAGLVLSTPLTVCMVVIGRYVPQLEFLHILLADEPVLTADAHLYQRLLAMDPQEARSVVDLYLKSSPLIDLYDTVLIPALNMAEHDRHRGAIDKTREDFLFLSVNEMIAEFSDYTPVALPAGEPADTEVTVERAVNRRILCVPAQDAADEIGAAMLAQLLEQDGCPAIAFPLGSSVREMLDVVNVGATDIVCVSSLPPYAFAPARAMCKQIRARFPKATLVVCIWGFTGDVGRAIARFERPQPQHLVTTLSQAVNLIRTLDLGEKGKTENSPAATEAADLSAV